MNPGITSFISFSLSYGLLTPELHMEVGCPGTQGLELLTPNPGGKDIPKACPTRNPAMSPARQTQPQPKHPSHRAGSSVEIITIINNNINDSNKHSNEIKGEEGGRKH